MDDTEKEWIEMKKWVAVLLLFSLLASVGISYADEEEKALILYFDYSENIDTTGLDADAVSQASMAGTRARDTSNLLVMVDVLTERLDADIYSLRVADLYAPGFGEMMNPAREQKENNEMLAFQEELPDFSRYDVIYLGTPVWWYGAPQSILTVLQQADLSSKKIVFFGIHRGSGFAGIPEEILSYQPDAVIVDRFTVECQTPNEETRSQFAAFLNQIAW